jgi:quercetin dioxygenase-like cupin family protein
LPAFRAGYARRMKRHRALVALSHDHHHGLVQARRLRRAAESDLAERREVAAAFVGFFARDTRPHFRDEEERFFPLLVGADQPASELLVRALLEHQRLYALVGKLDGELASGGASETTMRQLAQTLEEHIRFEERTVFPLIEKVASDEALRRLESASTARGPIDLPFAERTGPLWSTETEDLNATLLAWPPGAGPAEHVNTERDVLLVLLAGSATVTIDGETTLADAGQVITIEKGGTRRITAGPEGVRYLSIHVRRTPLQISAAPAR